MRVHFEIPEGEIGDRIIETGQQIVDILTKLVAVLENQPAAKAPKATAAKKAKKSDAIPAVQTSEEDASQDAADEAAEAESKAEDGKLTQDDLNRAIMNYTDIVGVAETLKNLSRVIGKPKSEIVSEEDIAAAITNVNNEIARLEKADKPEEKKKAPAAEETEKVVELKPAKIPATIDGVKEALKRYALAYDGTDDLHAATIMQTDCEAILTKSVGVAAISKIPADKYGDVVTAIMTAVKLNPYKRTRLQ